MLFEQLAHQPQRGALVAVALNKHIEDLAFVIHGAPQIHPFTGDPNYHFVQMPSVARFVSSMPASFASVNQHRTGTPRRFRISGIL
jgi:predicted glycosyltransferase